MLSFRGMTCVGAAVALILLPMAIEAQGPALKKKLKAGETDSHSGTFVQKGVKCSSNSTTQKDDKALEDANEQFVKDIKGGYICPTGTTKTVTTNPSPPFKESDCTFSFKNGCDGDPFKGETTAICTANVSWSITCTENSGG